MAKALYGHVGSAPDKRMLDEVTRLRTRVRDLEIEVMRLRAESDRLVALIVRCSPVFWLAQPRRRSCVDHDGALATAPYSAAPGGHMSPTLLELAVAIILLVVAWQIGVTIAPSILQWFRSLKQDVDEAAEQTLHPPADPHNSHNEKEHTNGTRH